MSHSARMVAAMVGILVACRSDVPTDPRPSPPDVRGSAPVSALVIESLTIPCTACVFGPLAFDREKGAPESEIRSFHVIPGTFVIDVDDLGSQGADGEVTLNGVAIMAARVDGEIGPRHYSGTLQLPTHNTLEVRLVGKPGSMLRVAVWPLMPVTLDAVTLAAGSTLQLEGVGAGFDATITNHTAVPYANIAVQAWIEQGSARRAGGGSIIYCQTVLGVLPPGTCVRTGNGISASNSAAIAGSGVLVAGTATAIIEVRQLIGSGHVVLDSRSVPIVLTAQAIDVTPPTGSIISGPAANSVFTAASGVGNFLISASDDMSGFSATPLRVIVTRTNAAGTTCVIGSGSACSVPLARPLAFDPLAGTGTPASEGYYAVTITLADQAGNSTNLVTGLLFLVDDPGHVAPGAAADIGFGGSISLPAVIAGATTNTFVASVADDIDLASLWGVTTYPTASIRHASATLGLFGPPLERGPLAANYAVSNWIRCLNVAGDFTTTTNRPTQIVLTMSDQAGNGSTQASSSFGPNAQACGAVGNGPSNSFSSGPPDYGIGKTVVDIDGANVSPTSSTVVTLSAVASVPHFPGATPFSRVDFYYENVAGNLVFIGTGNAVVTQDFISRYWTYGVSWDPDADVPVGPVIVVAIGVDAQGDAVLSNMHLVETMP